MKVSRILAHPFLQLLLLGLGLYALYGASGLGDSPLDRSIDVGPEDITRLQQQWQMQWNRPPTRVELTRLVDNYIREEVLYREALAAGFDRNDTVVRRRLVQKMNLLLADAAVPRTIDDSVLRSFFRANEDRYREPPRVSFTHVYFSPDRRGDRCRADAVEALRALRSEDPPPVRAPERGDRFMLHYDYAQRTAAELDQDFGRGFGRQVMELPSGEWAGPVVSGYGLHLVRVLERMPARLPEFESLRERLRADFVDQRRREGRELAYQRLKDQYEITVLPPEQWLEGTARQ